MPRASQSLRLASPPAAGPAAAAPDHLQLHWHGHLRDDAARLRPFRGRGSAQRHVPDRLDDQTPARAPTYGVYEGVVDQRDLQHRRLHRHADGRRTCIGTRNGAALRRSTTSPPAHMQPRRGRGARPSTHADLGEPRTTTFTSDAIPTRLDLYGFRDPDPASGLHTDGSSACRRCNGAIKSITITVPEPGAARAPRAGGARPSRRGGGR